MRKTVEEKNTMEKKENANVIGQVASQAIRESKELDIDSMDSSIEYVKALSDADQKEYELIEISMEKASSFEDLQKVLEYTRQMRKDRIEASETHDQFLLETQMKNHEHSLNVIKAVVVGIAIIGGTVWIAGPCIKRFLK